MEVILKPILKMILMIIIIPIVFTAFIMVQILVFTWSFRFIPYSGFFTNKESIEVIVEKRQLRNDKNPIETIKRWWNLDFFER